MQIFLYQITNFIEKIKNLMIWYHYPKTSYFFLMLLILAIIMELIPIRMCLIVYSIKKNFFN